MTYAFARDGGLRVPDVLAAAADREWTALTSWQSAALARDTNAAELIQRIAEETTQRLRAFG